MREILPVGYSYTTGIPVLRKGIAVIQQITVTIVGHVQDQNGIHEILEVEDYVYNEKQLKKPRRTRK